MADEMQTGAEVGTEVTTQSGETLSVEQYVDSILESVEPLGVLVPKSALASYAILRQEGNVRVSVFSTPAQVHNENLAAVNDQYSHSFTFRLKAFDQRLREVVALAYSKYGEEGGLDLAFLSRFMIAVNVHRNIGANDPILPMKGDKIVAQVRRATESVANGGGPASDRMGNTVVLQIAGFSVPPVVEAESFSL